LYRHVLADGQVAQGDAGAANADHVPHDLENAGLPYEFAEHGALLFRGGIPTRQHKAIAGKCEGLPR
jgi:hypothetical protein